MPTEAQTSNRGYQLPAAGNDLDFDVVRVIAALTAIDVDMQTALAAVAGYAALNSPAFTGVPTVPTATPGTNTSQIASTAFVKAALDALLDGAPAALNTLNEIAAAIADDQNYAATVTAAIAAVQADVDAIETIEPARFIFTAAGGETSLTGADDNAATLAFNGGREMVFVNGVLMVPGTDYGVSGGDTITALAALSAGDKVMVWAF